MASAQCSKLASEACLQKCQGSSSLGQKISEMASWAKGSNNGQQTKSSCTQAQTEPPYQAESQNKPSCLAHSQAHSCPNKGTCKAQPHRACHAAGKAQPQCGVNKASGAHHTNTDTDTHSHDRGHSHTKHQATNGFGCHCVNSTEDRHNHKHTANAGTACNGKTTVGCEQKERNLFRRIKNRFSSNSSCSDSSSDSDSDHECCHKRKN